MNVAQDISIKDLPSHNFKLSRPPGMNIAQGISINDVSSHSFKLSRLPRVNVARGILSLVNVYNSLYPAQCVLYVPEVLTHFV